MHAALLMAALLLGCLLAVQASVNQQLNKAVGTPYGASTVQLGLATGILLVLALATGAVADLGRVPEAEWWHLLGGLASPFYITSGILLIPRLGAVTTVGLFVSGQVFASIALDLTGALGVTRQPLSVGMAAGGVAVAPPVGYGVSASHGAFAGTVGVRLSAHPVARGVVATLGQPVTAPSANPTGQPPPTTAAAVLRYFPDGVALVLDAGPTPGGAPSTVLDVTVEPPHVIRQGAVRV